MEITVRSEVKGEVEAIWRRYEQHLSPDEIKRLTAGVLNRAARDAISNKSQGIKQEIRKHYNVVQSVAKNLALVLPKANKNSLTAGIKLNYKPIPLISFKNYITATNTGIIAQIKKGEVSMIPHAFLLTRSGAKRTTRGVNKGRVKIGADTHVMARGKYAKSGFVPTTYRGHKGYSPLSRIHTVSPFTMGLSDQVSNVVKDMMMKEVERGVEGALKAAVAKLKT